ncbi:ArsR/SmtB family transcription factor [Vibrio mangrovi]|uniref:Biofilm growth-associated repressor n=1 Tax=Vibrio mangrovi TaxID=474394 RepID=A0A1Y6IWE7_9VIBR|nr:metalloregulator ArsR/SmtB family transcription factor [Vibrio mangrovi]MDW6004524.1 metalloregulator ArsR/SmtB family transcription factor [Vibrio mangrovi]SMS00812.1 Biofilm growth-associated repressor [Vibrio mangrovi]
MQVNHESEKATDIERIKANAQEAADFLKMMAHPERLIVLCQLIQGEVGVGQLQQNSTLSQSALSQHLKVLRKHHLVVCRKSSQQVFYSLADTRAMQIITSLQELFCGE